MCNLIKREIKLSPISYSRKEDPPENKSLNQTERDLERISVCCGRTPQRKKEIAQSLMRILIVSGNLLNRFPINRRLKGQIITEYVCMF